MVGWLFFSMFRSLLYVIFGPFFSGNGVTTQAGFDISWVIFFTRAVDSGPLGCLDVSPFSLADPGGGGNPAMLRRKP